MSVATVLRYRVPAEQAGWRLRAVLTTGMSLSRRLLVRLRGVDGAIRVNGLPSMMHTPMQEDDIIEVTLPEEFSDDILPQPMDIEVLYEDEHLMIVNKPAGIIVHPTSGHYANTLANGIVHRWLERGERYRFRPIHRLDQDTSGVLAIAKNAYAHQFISDQFQRGNVHKAYLAVVYGELEPERGTVEGPIDRDPDEPHVRIVTPSGYASTTHFEKVHVLKGSGVAATLVRLTPVTGRTHQIRVHMKHIGHPLIGDELYMDQERYDYEAVGEWIDRQALHASELGFVHPETKEAVQFQSPLPQDMLSLINRLANK